MTKEISTDAELTNRLLTTQPTPAECLVAAARIEQLRARLARMEGALREIDALDPEAGYIGACSENAIRGLVLRMGEIARAALTDGGSNG